MRRPRGPPRLTVAEKMARFDALEPEPTEGPRQPWVVVSTPQTWGGTAIAPAAFRWSA